MYIICGNVRPFSLPFAWVPYSVELAVTAALYADNFLVVKHIEFLQTEENIN
jgi:hypothetical protein